MIMFYSVPIAIAYVLLAGLAAMPGLIVLHVAYAFSRAERSSGLPPCRYGEFIREAASSDGSTASPSGDRSL